MRVRVDESLCDGHGLCVAACPQVFDLAEDAETVTVLVTDPSEELRREVSRAAASCPKTAIEVEE